MHVREYRQENAGDGRMVQGKRIGAVVLSGGRGRRMNSAVQKQYMILDGKPLIAYALEAFERSQADQIVLVVGAGEENRIREEILAPLKLKKVSAVVAGGKERYHSVYEGLKALTGCDVVLIHDGARPLVSDEVIRRTVDGAIRYGACVAGMPVKDTIKVSDDDGFCAATPDRARLWQIQTPQAFSYGLVRNAYDWLMADPNRQQGVTDDAMVVESCTDQKVRLVEGSYENLKVTTPEDLILAEALLQNRKKENKSEHEKRDEKSQKK